MSKETKREIIIGVLALLVLVVLFVFAFPKMSNKTNKLDYVGTMGAKASLNDYTWDEISEISADIAEKGGASSYFEAFTRYAEEGQTKLVELLNGDKVEFRIIGIKHDSLADDSNNKVGLTFMAQNALKDSNSFYQFANRGPYNWNTGTLRAKLQEGGEIYNSFPEELTKNIKTIVKESLADSMTVISTNDKFFIPSVTEILGSKNSNNIGEGQKYEYINNDAFALGSASISCINHTGFEELKKNSSACNDAYDAFKYASDKSGTVNGEDCFLLRSIDFKHNDECQVLKINNEAWPWFMNQECPIVLCFCI